MYSIGHHLLSANAGGSANRHVLAPCLPPGRTPFDCYIIPKIDNLCKRI